MMPFGMPGVGHIKVLAAACRVLAAAADFTALSHCWLALVRSSGYQLLPSGIGWWYTQQGSPRLPLHLYRFGCAALPMHLSRLIRMRRSIQHLDRIESHLRRITRRCGSVFNYHCIWSILCRSVKRFEKCDLCSVNYTYPAF